MAMGPPHPLFHPLLPWPQTGSPNHLEKKESGIQVSVWREVLNLGGEVRRRNRWEGEDRSLLPRAPRILRHFYPSAKPPAWGGATLDGQGLPPLPTEGEAIAPQSVGGGLRDLPHSPLAPHVQMNDFPGRSPTRDPFRCSRCDSHGPPASPPASTHFRVCISPTPEAGSLV